MNSTTKMLSAATFTLLSATLNNASAGQAEDPARAFIARLESPDLQKGRRVDFAQLGWGSRDRAILNTGLKAPSDLRQDFINGLGNRQEPPTRRVGAKIHGNPRQDFIDGLGDRLELPSRPAGTQVHGNPRQDFIDGLGDRL